MKTILKVGLTALFLIGLSETISAQTASVEKSVFGIQTGFLGIWAHHE